MTTVENDEYDMINDYIDESDPIKVSDDIDVLCDSRSSSKVITYSPRHTRQGKAMHGVYIIRDYEDRLDEYLIYINKGNVMSYYHYPIIEREFESPMINLENLHFCGGWSWSYPDESSCDRITEDEKLVDRVINGKKPACSIYAPDETLDSIEKKISKHGHVACVRRQGKSRYNWILIYQTAKFDDLFDLDSLEYEYKKYWKALGRPGDPVSFAYLRGKSMSDFIDADLDWGCEYGIPFVGLVYGYPIESTVDRFWSY
jgi:hypothetical protein